MLTVCLVNPEEKLRMEDDVDWDAAVLYIWRSSRTSGLGFRDGTKRSEQCFAVAIDCVDLAGLSAGPTEAKLY